MFALDHAGNILPDLAKEYLQSEKLAEATDSRYGAGCILVPCGQKKYYNRFCLKYIMDDRSDLSDLTEF